MFDWDSRAVSVLERLEKAGHRAVLVGGCVRDSLLGIPPHDYDAATSALPEEIKAACGDLSCLDIGLKHGTITVLSGGISVETTTFRKETTYSDHRHPDAVEFTSELREDLARRDFTINAMAWERGSIVDPFDGQGDLGAKLVRCVGDPNRRFEEDALRILRGIRFASRYNLSVEEKTRQAMFDLAPRMESLARERVFEEVNRFLQLAKAEDLLTFAPILAAVIPELEQTLGFDQHSPHHAYDVFTHIAYVTAAVPSEPALRWAALLHDVGKPATFTTDETGRGHFYTHAQVGAEMANTILLRLKAPTQLREEVALLISQHMTKLEPEKRFLRRCLNRLGSDRVERLLQLQEADMGSKGTGKQDQLLQFSQVRALLAEIKAENSCLQLKDLAVNGNDLLALGLTGKQIGETLNSLLEQVMDDVLPNDRSVLLEAAKNRN